MLVGIPALLMGGTLPVLVRSEVRLHGVDTIGARLYAANTAGAIAGALATSFAMIPAFGVRGSAFAAAALNLGAAGIALAIRSPIHPPIRPPVSEVPFKARLALTLYAIAGGVALGYEVVWSQAIVQFMSTRTFAFAVVLATYLAGLAIGSALYSRYAPRIRDHWGLFAILITAAGLVAVLEITLLGRWLVILQTQAEWQILHLTGSTLAGMCARFTVAAGCIVFLPTLLLGAAFPAVLRLTAVAEHTGRDVGATVAWNTLGGIAGTMLAGFVLIPHAGLIRTLLILAVAASAIGAIAILRGSNVSARARAITFAAIGSTLICAATLPREKLASLLPGAREGRLAFYEESAAGTVAVVEQQASRFRRLYIQGVSNSGDAMPSLRYMRLQALIPLLIHSEEPQSVLVIGLGTGITVGTTIPYPGLQRRVCAELLPAIVRAAPLFHGNYSAPTNPKVEVRLRDGRRELLRSSEHYDVITLEPPPPSAAGVVNLYSRDFYKLAAGRLNSGGILAQWLPLPTQNDEDSQSLVRSFLDAFPHVSLWTTELHEMLLVGSYAPIELDANRLIARFQHPEVATALAEIGIATPAALLATWITDREGLERYAGIASPVTDDQPRIEYAPWVRDNEITRVLPVLLHLTTEPPLRGASPDLRKAIATERVRLFAFYAGGLAAYEKDGSRSRQLLEGVLKEDPENRYFRWFAAR
jgi:spermidine synthase